MTDRPVKRVLIVDDVLFTCNDVRAAFLAHNTDANGAFTFEVDITLSIADAIDMVRAKQWADQYDVIVLDLSFDTAGEDRSGFRIADALGLHRRLGQTIPVEIIFTGYANVRNCVQAMRCGAWDVIHKLEEVDDKNPFQLVVDSAVSRLRALELQQLLNVVALKWLQQHVSELQTLYAGQVVAIWNEPDVRVVASGRDAFELETQLESWRQGRPSWMYPFVVDIPEMESAAPTHGV